jgi:hypothetical protein
LRLWHDREAGEKYGGISAPAVAEPARITGGDYNALLTQYAIERFLYRLSKSELADHFILKGAMLFRVWSGTTHRPTKDLDLLGSGDPSPNAVADTIRHIIAVSVNDDGMTFDASSIEAREIREA